MTHQPSFKSIEKIVFKTNSRVPLFQSSHENHTLTFFLSGEDHVQQRPGRQRVRQRGRFRQIMIAQKASFTLTLFQRPEGSFLKGG
jgi:hypothetical protein